MKILVLVHALPGPGSGGVEAVAMEQARALRARGHEVRLFTRAAGPGSRPRSPEGEWYDAQVEEFPVRYVSHAVGDPPNFRALFINKVFDRAFASLLAEFRPDIVHAQHLVHLSLGLAAAARQAGIPFVLSLHDFFFLCDRLFLLDREGQRCAGPDRGERCVACLAEVCAPVDARWRFAAMQEALACADALVAPGASLAHRMVGAMPGLATKLRVIEPGIEVSGAGAARIRVARVRQTGPLRFLFVGGAQPHKGLDLLIEACAGLDPEGWELSVRGGAAPESAWWRGLRARSAGLPIHWQGGFAPRDAPMVFAAADVLVVASRCDESWSRVVREARVAGCAVVAPAVGGPAALLEHGRDALLVEPASAPALGAALRRLLAEEGLCASLQAAATPIATTVQAAGELELLFHELLGRGTDTSGTLE